MRNKRLKKLKKKQARIIMLVLVFLIIIPSTAYAAAFVLLKLLYR